MAGTLFVVATPIGNLEDITARAVRVLREVAVIAAEDTRRTSRLLTRYGIATPTTSLHKFNERAKTSPLIARLLAGENVALVSDAGTPTISDPGAHLVAEAVKNNVRVEPLPGPSAVMAALSVSTFPTTPFTFLGFPPARGKDRQKWFKALSLIGHTVVFYEAPHRIKSTLKEIRQLSGNIEVVVGRELTKIHEELVIGPITEIAERIKPVGEFTVVLRLVQTTDSEAPNPVPRDAEVHSEFWRLTENDGLSRRAAISTLAKRHGLTSRHVYAIIEKARCSGCCPK